MAIRIPRYESRNLATRVGNVDPGFVQPLINRAGQDAASSTMQSLLDSGKQLGDVAIKQYVSSETARVSEALQSYRNQLADEQARYSKENQGQNALGAGEHFDAFARDTAAPLAEKFSGKFRNMFMQDAAAYGLRFKEHGQAYAQQQEHLWKRSNWEGDVAQTMDTIAQDPGNAAFVQTSLQNLKGRYADMFPGMDPRAMDADLNHKVAGITIDSFLAKDQVGQARSAFNQYRDILGAAAPQFESRINTKGRELEARARAERAERQFDVHSRAQDAIAAWNTGQDSPTAPSKQEVISAYGAEKGGRIWQSLESSQQFGADMKTLGTMTPEQQNELLEKRTPVPGDGFAIAQENHARLTRAIKADQEWRLKDPVSYLLTNDKDAQGAFKAWQESPTPENTQSYVMKLQAGAAARGIRQSASEAQPVLPGNAAKDLAWRISNSDKPAELIAQQKAAWGDYWPSVERQLVHDDKLPGGLRVVASGMDAQSGGLLASTFRNPKFVEQSKDALGLTESTFKDMHQRVQTEMAPFTATLRAQGDLEAESRLTDSATRLTMVYMQQGFDMKEAAAKSAKDVALGRYGINGSYRVPAGKDVNTISKGADNALFELTSSPDKLALPQAGGLSSEYILQSYGSALRRDASWVTAPDESGLILYAAGKRVTLANGKPVFFSWGELEKESRKSDKRSIINLESSLEDFGIGGQ